MTKTWEKLTPWKYFKPSSSDRSGRAKTSKFHKKNLPFFGALKLNQFLPDSKPDIKVKKLTQTNSFDFQLRQEAGRYWCLSFISQKILKIQAKLPLVPIATIISVPNPAQSVSNIPSLSVWGRSSTGNSIQAHRSLRLNELGQPFHGGVNEINILRHKKIVFSFFWDELGKPQWAQKPLQSWLKVLREGIEELAAELPRNEEFLVPQHISDSEVSQPGLWNI